MKYYSFCLFLTSLVLVSCGGNGEDSNDIQAPPSPNLKAKYLYRVTGFAPYEYYYDSQGRLNKILIDWYTTSTFSYDNNTIIENEVNKHVSGIDNTTYYRTKQIVYTLENGCVTKRQDKDSNTTDVYSYKNGYLVREIREEKPNYYSAGDFEYQWENGNLMRITTVYNNNNYEYCRYEYTDYDAPQGFFPLPPLDRVQVLNLYFGGMNAYYGKSMKKLPSKIVWGSDLTFTFEWTLNEEGMPVRLILTTNMPNEYPRKAFTFEWV